MMVSDFLKMIFDQKLKNFKMKKHDRRNFSRRIWTIEIETIFKLPNLFANFELQFTMKWANIKEFRLGNKFYLLKERNNFS